MSSAPRGVAGSFIHNVDRSVADGAPRVPRAPSQFSRAPPTHRSQRSLVEVNKPLPNPQHTRSVSQPPDIGTAAIVGSRGPHKDSKYPAWEGSDPKYDNYDMMAYKSFIGRASAASHKLRTGSDDLAVATAVPLPP
jgi:hypothetical protein